MNTMVKTDIAALETDLLARIAAAADEQALEAERVAALGKKGAVSDLLKGLGAMTPEERQVMGPALNGLKDRIGEAIAARRAVLKEAELATRLEAERIDVTLPLRPSPLETGRIHPVSQVIDMRAPRGLIDVGNHGVASRRDHHSRRRATEPRRAATDEDRSPGQLHRKILSAKTTRAGG